MKRQPAQGAEEQAQTALAALASILGPIIRAEVRAELDSREGVSLERPRAGYAAQRLTVAEAAKELRCSAWSVRRLISSGRLRASKLSAGGSSRVLIARAEIDRLLSETQA